MAEPDRRRLHAFGASLMLGLLAEQAVLFAVPLLVFQRTGSVGYAGMAFAVEWLPALLAYPFAGLLADRLGGRRLFLAANTARALVLISAALLCALRPHWTVGVLMAGSGLLSLCMAPVRMAVEKTTPALAGDGALSRLQALVQNLELLGRLLGPGLAALLAHALGKLPLLPVAACGFALSALCWRGLPGTQPVQADAQAPGHAAADLVLGWTLLWRNRPLRLLAGVGFIINLAFAVAVGANASVITGVFGASDHVFGLMNAAAGLCGLLALRLVPRLPGPQAMARLGTAGYAVLCAGMAAMAWTHSVAVYAAAFALSIGGAAWFNLFNRTLRVQAVASAHLGKVIGVFYLVQYLPFPVAGLVTAALGPTLGVQAIYKGMALLLALPGAVLMLQVARGAHDALLPRPDAPAAPRAAVAERA
ncbi:MFS transporter [Azohydromonas lata]|uniref:MFS transporter n=1 Tax=Azohydromonas lata TaxID=45677 RepID=UPI0009FF12F4|nr:MFS transporter [Azohydromonas lata]